MEIYVVVCINSVKILVVDVLDFVCDACCDVFWGIIVPIWWIICAIRWHAINWLQYGSFTIVDNGFWTIILCDCNLEFERNIWNSQFGSVAWSISATNHKCHNQVVVAIFNRERIALWHLGAVTQRTTCFATGCNICKSAGGICDSQLICRCVIFCFDNKRWRCCKQLQTSLVALSFAVRCPEINDFKFSISVMTAAANISQKPRTNFVVEHCINLISIRPADVLIDTNRKCSCSARECSSLICIDNRIANVARWKIHTAEAFCYYQCWSDKTSIVSIKLSVITIDSCRATIHFVNISESNIGWAFDGCCNNNRKCQNKCESNDACSCDSDCVLFASSHNSPLFRQIDILSLHIWIFRMRCGLSCPQCPISRARITRAFIHMRTLIRIIYRSILNLFFKCVNTLFCSATFLASYLYIVKRTSNLAIFINSGVLTASNIFL